MKKINILILSCLLIILSSCSKEEEKNRIPWAAVNYEINLNGADHILNNPTATKTYLSSQLAGRYVGFSGLLVVCGLTTYNSGAPVLYVYDLCCPNEGTKDAVIQPASDGLTANCPKCNSEYDIISGIGNVKSGPSQESLQRYQAIPENPYNGRYSITRIN
jgi:hypothetical protein